MSCVRRPLLAALLIALATMASAAARPFVLDPAASRVTFTWRFGEDPVAGSMPVARADLLLDLDDVGASRVSVAVDASRAEAGFPFASQAMRGPRVLDAGAHPLITFESRRVTLVADGRARVEGDLTIRGVTRPATFDATLTSADADLSRLTVALHAAVHRSDFGATGWADMVGDEVTLDIAASLVAGG